ncbi:MAG: hypothetical protein ACRDQZ_10015 [Mycobacteriales bacterium]
MKDDGPRDRTYERTGVKGENATKTLNATIMAFVAMALFDDTDQEDGDGSRSDAVGGA